MGSMRNLMLGAAVLAGTAGLGAIPAQAAQFGVYVHGPVAYVPPSPGMGHAWIDGYMSGGYWVPGRWVFGGYRGHDRFVGHDYYYGHDRDRHFDRDAYRDHGHDRFRR